jgi:antitoxin (DNA-binding transcriptional repressor) of toxin-antitoxin stability system
VRTVDIRVAALQLSRLVELVAAGEEIVIADGGAPVARLLPFEPRREPRKAGLLKGQIWIAADFDDPLPEEIMAAFRGERP